MPVIFGAPVFQGEDMGEPLRVRPDGWSTSGSVLNTHPDPIVAVLGPMDIVELPICTQDIRIIISQGQWSDDRFH